MSSGAAPSGARTEGRAWLTLSNTWRYPLLWASRAIGWAQRLTRRGWWPFALMLGVVTGLLIVVPLLLRPAVSLLEWLGVDDVDPAPDVGDWVSLQNVALLFALGVFLRWISHARERVVVEGFVDYTTEDEKAVSGLSTLLVTELGRLRDLYNQVSELSVPTAVGVERQGGFNRGKEAAAFLTVSADDVTSVLEGAVASEARIEVGPAKIPIGPLLAFFNRLTRGPRVVGTVHLTEAGGGPTLTAQLVGTHASGTWRVDQPAEPESAEQRKAFLDTMVRELACRMFTQLTLAGSVRWEAVHAFNEYLRLYGASRRTPRDRARYLKKAQGKLLSAVAEDERFDLAYYNLGVICTQLVEAELTAERQSNDATSRAQFDRDELNRARREAARVAFARAAEMNPGRWEAHYALAVTSFSNIPDMELEEGLGPRDARRARLRDVVRLCNQALGVSPRPRTSTATVYDLRGMAQTRLGEFDDAMRSHRKAVAGSWIGYCDAERRAWSRGAGEDDNARRAKANATAALHNLALAHVRRALVPGPTAERSQDQWRRDLSAAARILRWAIRLAGEGNDQAAASHFERGVVLEHKEDYGEAAREFKTAAQIHLANCEYPARRARALARHWSVSGDPQFREDACEEAAHALRMLARTFSLAVAPFAASAIDLRCNATLKALADTYRILGADPDTERIRGIKELKETLQAWGGRDSVDPKAGARQLAELRKHEARRPRGGRADPDWELEQIEVALGRLQSKARDWRGARGTFEGLIGRLRGTHPERLVEFSAYANYARALRECGYYAEALRAAAEGVRRDPLNVEGRREAGRAHFALGQFGDALASWEHAMWLSPSDPYLHYEVGMCHRRMAGSAPDAAQRDQRLAVAASHFASAEELFDGEDLTGQAWTRLWQGRIALERGRTAEAIAHLEAGSHSSARPAGLLLLGEARLELGARSVAEHAFEACEKALGKGSARRSPKQTLDPGWGDELPLAAVRARVKRGLAEAVHLAPGDWQNETELTKARDDIKAAKDELQTLEPAARDEALTMCLDTEAKILHALGEIEEALELIRERLRYGAPRHALVQEAELLSLLAAGNRRIDERSRVRIAARHARETVARNGSIA